MSVVGILMLVMVGTSAAFGSLLAWLFARKGLGGPSLQNRLDHLEAEVKRLGGRDARHELDDEVRRLDEKVEFLEALLADRSKAGALPAGDMDDSGGDKPHPV